MSRPGHRPRYAPYWRRSARPSAASAGFVTLPPAARDKLGLTWSAADERRLRTLGQAIARGTANLPERVRYMPIAYRARQAAHAQERLDRTLALRPM